jgi:hypothetical protein
MHCRANNKTPSGRTVKFFLGKVLLPILTQAVDETVHFDFKSVVKQCVKWFLLKRNISKYAHCYHQFCAKLSVSTD